MENGQDSWTVGEYTMKNYIETERYGKFKTGFHPKLCMAEDQANT